MFEDLWYKHSTAEFAERKPQSKQGFVSTQERDLSEYKCLGLEQRDMELLIFEECYWRLPGY